MVTPFFIDENVQILTGRRAREALKQENDERYYREGDGIVRVGRERWEKAQACEFTHWMKKGLHCGNDRNDDHYVNFNAYRVIKKSRFHSAVEIGCGPFTNARMVSRQCRIEKISLLDPMIDEYLHHPFSAYSQQYLFSDYHPFIGKIVRRGIPSIFRKYQRWCTRRVKIHRILNMPAEKMPTDDPYDLIIMINVLEHCYDAGLIFRNILDVANPKCVFIFQDRLYSQDKIPEMVKNEYDAAHPLKVDSRIIYDFLHNHFDVLFGRELVGSMVFKNEQKFWKDLYFIGRIK